MIGIMLCLTLCSCERRPTRKLGPVPEDPTWISNDRARVVGWQLLTNRYPEAQIIYEKGALNMVTFGFETNHTTAPIVVVVDRETGKARFENASH